MGSGRESAGARQVGMGWTWHRRGELTFVAITTRLFCSSVRVSMHRLMIRYDVERIKPGESVSALWPLGPVGELLS